MIRFSGLFFMRGKGFGSLFQNIQHRTSPKLIISELSTVGTQIELKDADKVNDRNKKVAKGFLETTVRNIINNEKNFETFKNVKSPTSDFRKMLDLEATLPMIESLLPYQVIQMLKLLVHKNNRSVKLLKGISRKICSSSGELNLKMCSDLLYCLAKLSYKDQVLLDAIGSRILSHTLSSDNVMLLASIIQSIGVLRYRNCSLIEVLLQNILEHDTPRKTQEMLKSLLTLAVVNFNSPYGKVLLKELQKCNQTDFHATKSYLEFVWSCVLLNELSNENISYVLSKNYINLLSLIDGPSGTGVITNLKLQNINAAATTLMPSYDGPTLIQPVFRPQYSKSKSQFLTLVLDGLFNIFPKNGFLSTSKNTNAGFLLDVECALDSQGQPTPLNKKEEHTKIGIMLLDFNDFCIDGQNTVTGLISFRQRILEAQGYKIIAIPYMEYNNKLNLNEKVKYLKEKFKAVCNN